MSRLSLALLRLLCRLHPDGHDWWRLDGPTCVRCGKRWTA